MLSELLARPGDIYANSISSHSESEMADDENEKQTVSHSHYGLDGSGAVGSYGSAYIVSSSMELMTEVNALVESTKQDFTEKMRLLQNEMMSQKSIIEAQRLEIMELSQKIDDLASRRSEINIATNGHAGSNARYIYMSS